MVSYNLYFKQITNRVKYDDYHYSDFRLQLYDVLKYIIPFVRRSIAFICVAGGWSVSCSCAVSSHGWASACRESSGLPELDNRCERAPAPPTAWADCNEHG